MVYAYLLNLQECAVARGMQYYTEVYTLANPSGIAEGRRDEGAGEREV